MKDLVTELLAGNRRALAKAITLLENRGDSARELMRLLYPFTGKAHVVGITGSPGAGKSSLVNRFITQARSRGQKVGVVAIDPNSPFSGGAILGDRVRMQEHALDSGVFIRSMSTRGFLGGIAVATNDVVKAMDACGMDFIIVETVGVGQSELEVMHVVESVAVVLTPGGGDAIQSMKAGIMEIADLFIVNKCDVPGAAKVVAETEAMLDMRPASPWRPPVLEASSAQNMGVDRILDALVEHRRYLMTSGRMQDLRKQQAKREIQELLWEEHLYQLDILWHDPTVEEWLQQVMSREIDAYQAAAQMKEYAFREKMEYK